MGTDLTLANLEEAIEAFESKNDLSSYTPLTTLIQTVDALASVHGTALSEPLQDQISWYRANLARRLELAPQSPVTEDDLDHYRQGWQSLTNTILHTLHEQQARLSAEHTITQLKEEHKLAIEFGEYSDLHWGTEEQPKGLLSKKAGRKYGPQFLQREVQAMQSHHDHGLGVILLDIDYFKQINDTYDHNRGDYVLMQVAQSLYHLFSPEQRGDLLIRFGGEELLVLVSHISKLDLLKKAAQVQKKIAGLDLAVDVHDPEKPEFLDVDPTTDYVTPQILQAKEISPFYMAREQEMGITRNARQVTASIGVLHSDDATELIHVYGTNPETLYDNLIRKADKMLYTAKKHGRNAFAHMHTSQ